VKVLEGERNMDLDQFFCFHHLSERIKESRWGGAV
jgi:hypothetical protein